jgi:hypothetical protein
MRSDITPGGTFPDYALPDHESNPRKLSEARHDLDRHPSRQPGLRQLDRCAVAVALGPGADRAEGPELPAVY